MTQRNLPSCPSPDQVRGSTAIQSAPFFETRLAGASQDRFAAERESKQPPRPHQPIHRTPDPSVYELEVKDAPKARGLRPSRSLSSKFGCAFLPPRDEWIFQRTTRLPDPSH